MNPLAAAKQETITAAETSRLPKGPATARAASAATVSVPTKSGSGSARR